ncbi:hypothetical protein EMQ25_11630 [Arsenicitalea aurantiaca]|uniref:Uncharacterized protein n=1 Tax=Arsenicitalea aurantiaca TaxID=1783274 RepID=A0A433X7G0_9HYPH|nr:hypothetical protein EMQ25_11630 [Arsenicitalea aurantiaca]
MFAEIAVSYVKIRLPRGILKVKRSHQLRRRERDRQVPVWRVGSVYIVWSPNAETSRRDAE